MFYLIMSFVLVVVILSLFFLLSSTTNLESLSSSVFECGFSSYYFSRFSFSMHYFTIGLIFLFLDLELCYLMPFFNFNSCDISIMTFIWVFIVILTLGLLEEWKFGLLDWKF